MLEGLTLSPPQAIATFLAVSGAVASVITFLWNQVRAVNETMMARYDAVSRSYVEYQSLCLQFPEAETSSYRFADPNSQSLDERTSIQRKILFDIFTSTIERAFLTYLTAPAKIRSSQWPGWDAFAKDFASREDYRRWWRENVFDFESEKWRDGVSQYDLRFERYMKSLLIQKSG
jgi:hypothetical protein